MKTHKFWDLARKHFSEEEIERIRAEVRTELMELNLKAVRELLGKTQAELAQATKISQAELSRTEHRDDHRLSTLRRYIEALGGELEVIAKFGDKMVKLHGV
jgi:DNA-binding XRE family transcriptional regulator